MNVHLTAMVSGALLDLLIGDPQAWIHPVQLIGMLITAAEKGLRRLFPKTEKGELAAGAVLTVITVGCTGAAAAAILALASLFGKAGTFLAETILIFYLLAARSLRDESMNVCRALQTGTLAEARTAVSRIVGRDTACLDEAGVTKAAVETVAENASDGVIAPLFYLALGGPVLAWIYKAVNTMDSMVGYRNERYLFFGRAAARLDDVLNWLPSRLSAFLMMGAAFLLRMNARGAYEIWKRDRRNHKSPNSAQTEAACAGALSLRLAGDAYYFGKLLKKPFIGDDIRQPEPEDIRRANRLMLVSAAEAFLPALALRAAVLLL